MHQISLFKSFTKVIGYQSLNEILEDIRSGRYKNQISKIRRMIKDGQEDKSDQLKKQLQLTEKKF